MTDGTLGQSDPDWLTIALGERGVLEVAGPAVNARIIQYHATCTMRATSDEVPWCSAFVNWCITTAGLKGTNSAAAKSWQAWGLPCAPKRGAIVVLTRTGGNHVGFWVGEDAKRLSVLLLGGNQGDAVKVSAFPLSRVLAYRWPKEG